MSKPINTPNVVAGRLGLKVRRVQQLIKELGIEPETRIGKTAILSEAQIRQISKRKDSRKK